MSNSDTQIRDRLKAIREQIKDARGRHADARKDRDAARDAFAGGEFGPDTKITDAPEFKAAEEAVRKVGVIDDELADLQLAEQGILGILGQAPNGNGGNGGNPSLEAPRTGWNGHQLLANSDMYRSARETGVFSSTARFGTVNLGEIASREEAVGFLAPRQAYLPAAAPGPISTPTGAGAVPPDVRGIIQPFLRPLSLLDLIPTGTTDSNVVQYVQVTALPQGAAETAQLAVKPELGLETLDATAPVRTIAGWIKAARQQLDDVAGLATLINTLLPYEVRRRMEAQMLAGDGDGQNLLGILNTTGVAEPDAVSGDNAADAILKAMTLVHLAGATPNFVAVNPLTWQDLLLLRTDVGGAHTGMYVLGGPGTMAASTIWGMQITPSLIVDQAAPLVGDSMGATLLVREGVNVKTSDSDQDDFVRNRITVLSEARVAFPIWRPSAFAVAAIPS